MDAAEYARIRELFLAVEELPADERMPFLQKQAEGDSHLINEVLSLLNEHHPEFARIEGETAKPVGRSMIDTPALPTATGTSRSGPKSKSPSKPSKQETKRGAAPSGAQVTQHSAQRTHASPKYPVGGPDDKRSRRSFWDQHERHNRRWNSGWLWVAALLPTAIVGWLTYRQVAASLRGAVANELTVIANSTSMAAQKFLDDKASLVASWSREPEILNAITEMVAIGEQKDPIEKLKAAEQPEIIRTQLQKLSGFETVKFVVWNRSGMLLCSWLPDRSDFGIQVTESGARNHIRVFQGKSVLFGPARLSEYSDGFRPETSEPVIANIVPIRKDDGEIIAAMLVRGIETYEQFDNIFREVSESSGFDAYAVNSSEIMVTNSLMALQSSNSLSLELQKESVAVNLRVTDPGTEITPANIGSLVPNATGREDIDPFVAWRRAQPLTVSCASVTNRESDVCVSPYNNYAGETVVGAWAWNQNWDLGVVVERDYVDAFTPARIVQLGFLILGGLLSLTAYLAAAQLAKQSAKTHAALHPLGRYELVGELGSGGMGVVYKARHKQLGRDVALKVLRSDRRNRDDRLRFGREAKLAASLSNSHSVQIYDYGHSDGGEAFCVMEFLQGITLYESVMRSGAQSFGRVLFILRQICDSLIEAHESGLLHRDIKPQNVMLSLDASVGDWAVVFDFGLAKPVNPDAGSYQTAEMVWAGTPMYMAPERYRDPGGMDPRSDVYSIGCIAYFLISGRPPYVECDPESLFALVLSEEPLSMSIHRDADVPQELVDLVNGCMAKDVDDRFESTLALSRRVDDLREKFPWTVEQAREWWQLHGNDPDE